jgi:hypothetical protein
MTIGRSARRVLIVCAATAACGMTIGVGPASAASTAPTTNGGLLGLGTLVSGLTTGVSNTLSDALAPTVATTHSSPATAQQSASTPAQPSDSSSKSSGADTVTASAAPLSLGSVLESLPVLGPVVTPLVEDLPILGGKATPAISPSTPTSTSTAPVSAIVHSATTPQAGALGSTWTRSTPADTAPVVQPHTSGSNDSPITRLPGDILSGLKSGKAEVGAAAVALIILGGVAVAGAAGAAGAAGRRQFVGGPW